MKKSIIFIVLLCMGCSMLHAQEVYNSSGKPGYHKKQRKKKGYDPDKLVIGGGLNGGIGGGYINAGVSPIVGYRFADMFAAGVGLGYQYDRAPDYVDPTNPYQVSYIHANIIYPSLWARCFIYRNLFADAVFEYNIINLRRPHFNYYTNEMETLRETDNVPCALVGIGLRQPLGGRVSFYGEIMHDLLQQDNSPYAGQFIIFKFGIAAGF